MGGMRRKDIRPYQYYRAEEIVFVDVNNKNIMERSLTFITGNAGKAKYLADYFHIPVEHKKLDLPEIQSLDLEEIVKDKARRAYEIVKAPVLVEDVSLTFTAMKRLPGPLIKWFLEELGNEGLCRMLDGYERSVVAEVAFAFCDGKNVKVFTGSREGKVSEKPRGTAGFGWDSIFIPEGHTETWAEMTADEKHETSMRRIALEKLRVYLNI